MKIDKQLIANKKLKLEEVARQLKTEFFGLDTIIDKVIASVYSWYVFPQLIKRPVIVNLWGMTGVGKTQLVRRLSTLLGYAQKFVEVQMDGTSGGSLWGRGTICSMLSNCIDEGEEGILLLDEIQRFRTVGDNGAEIKVERFQDVWMLLSDGKFATDSDLFLELEMMVASALYSKDSETAIDDDEDDEDEKAEAEAKPVKKVKVRAFQIHPWQAKSLKKLLRLKQPLEEIMTWDAQKVDNLIRDIRDTRVDWQIDYSKLLIFISGNLDSAFIGSESSEDCDTDADFYHKLTSKITTIQIKKALQGRFKPEQISRFGSNHIIYPSMTRLSYQQLIKATCLKYMDEMHECAGIKFTPQDRVYEVIYNNAVYPTQGTRPVFSSIHTIFSTGLVNVACWCLENNIKEASLDIDEVAQKMRAQSVYTGAKFETSIELELSVRKAKINDDTKTLVAVHEAGHAIVYAVLTGSAPIETKINAISFAQGYILPNDQLNDNKTTTKKSLLDRIAMMLGGTVAEEIVFGADNRSIGAMSDIYNATLDAGRYVRHYGFDSTLSFTQVGSSSMNTLWNTDLKDSNKIIEEMMQTQFDHAKIILTEHRAFLSKLVNKLLEVNTLNQEAFISVAEEFIKLERDAVMPAYHEQWKVFAPKGVTE